LAVVCEKPAHVRALLKIDSGCIGLDEDAAVLE
jgi:hypothetical protein